jgi:von Willebrand factor type A domain
MSRSFFSLAFVLVACGGGLTLTPIRSTQSKPSNVAVYFKVEKGDGTPIGGLSADTFKIYEDRELVSQFESKQTILNPEVAASHYTLLLVDMSGSVSGSGSVDALVDAAGVFAEKVENQQRVAIYAFDGSSDLYPIVSFTNAGGAKAGVKQLASFKPKDPSTNLNGAVVKGLAELDKALASAEHPMHFGTLVVFTDGTDRARRVSKDDMNKALSDTKYDVFAIGLGAEMQDAQLKEIGKDGTAHADDKASVVNAFDAIATRIESRTKSYYLLSYCSPSRAGKHEVRIEATSKDEKTGEVSTGSLTSDFDATGFTPNCDPNQKPTFDLTKGDALAPKKDDAKKDDKATIHVETKTTPPTTPTPAPTGTGESFTP